MNDDSVKGQHAAAVKESGVPRFSCYSLLHTCITRWAESDMDPATLQKVAGNADVATTLRYIHMNDRRTRMAMETARAVPDGTILGTVPKNQSYFHPLNICSTTCVLSSL